MLDILGVPAILVFPLIKLAKKLKDQYLQEKTNGALKWFPLIKLAKKLKEGPNGNEKRSRAHWFPLIKLAKKLKGAIGLPGLLAVQSFH